MPSRNTIKQYVEGGYYHIYNRGIDKREIFLDESDSKTFLYLLKIYLSSQEELLKQPNLNPRTIYKIAVQNLNKEIDLLSFALMPNHFHLHMKQYTRDGIEKLTRRIFTSYVQYFNKKYSRIGPLFESAYKAVLINTDEQNLYLSSYIHRNHLKLKPQNVKTRYLMLSSYPYYLGSFKSDWVKPAEILSFFRSKKNINKDDILSYQSFLESKNHDPENLLDNKILLDRETPY